MRSLVILRGSPGAGKSTWINEMGLKNYTLCADDIRMLVESPILTENGCRISQKNDNYVWSLLFELLEKRMSRGEFVIVDATHSRSSDFSRYNSLCEKYRYRRYYVDFSDVDIDVCKKRNKMRPEYKQVPESVIDKMYARLKTQSKTSGWVEVDKEHFWEEIGTKIFDFNDYKKIHIFGDIHGCYSALKKYLISQENSNIIFDYNKHLELTINDNEMYIFCGDYLDRGLENKQVLELLIKLSKLSNVLFLEGNHELWLKMYANDDEESIRSRTFLNKTKYEIEEIDKSEIRTFCRKLGQLAYFKYDNTVYFITHGGLNYIPEELQLIATDQFIHGVGDYNLDIDTYFANSNNNIVQVHGHRNMFEIDNVDNFSYNLEGKIEFGGNLKVLELSKKEKPKMIKIKNDVFGTVDEADQFRECKSVPMTAQRYIEELKNSKYVRETKITQEISSFNFTRDAFFKKHWNDITTKARGLFVNTVTGEVIARGYDKFFNINERKETEIPNLAKRFNGHKVICYKKYNGFLGIMSYVNNELFIASKSTTKSEFAEYFRNIFENSDINKDNLVKYLSENNVSLTFEVIDPINDPHIIEYDRPQLVLLDIIDNSFEFNKRAYEEVKALSEFINCPCKEIYKTFTNFRDFHEWYLKETDKDNLSQINLEGVVIEFDNFMTKLKFPYYNFWKLMRGIKESVARGKTVKLSKLYNAEANYFYDYLRKQPIDKLKESIIDLRKGYLDEK